MCGIHGFGGDDAELVGRMVNACRHRGPDGSGIWRSQHLTLGHNLLAIVASPGKSLQPIQHGAGTLVYNGEIYNTAELSRRMLNKRFDTDAYLLAALLADDPSNLKYVDGMYAFAWAPQGDRGPVWLARDKNGAKPLYYTRHLGKLLFSSEIRGLLAAGVRPVLDMLGFQLYMEFGYIPGPSTLLRGVSKLVPGELRYVYPDGRLKGSGYVSEGLPAVDRESHPSDFSDALRQSVKNCLVGIRPTCLYLSGGLDSASILEAARNAGAKLLTLTMRLEGGTPEAVEDADVARRLAKEFRFENVPVTCTELDYVEALEDAAKAQDDPIYNRGLPAYLIMHMAAKKLGQVVVLTGDGGDELLAGYARHRYLVDERKQKKAITEMSQAYGCDGWRLDNPVKRWHWLTSRGGSRFVRAKEPLLPHKLFLYMDTWLPTWASPAYSRDKLRRGAEPIREHQVMERFGQLAEDYLMRNDKLGMSCGLECRMPLLSEPFRSYAIRQHPGDLTQTKQLSRAAYQGLLPDYVLNKVKTGWSMPTGAWLENAKSPLRSKIGEVFGKSEWLSQIVKPEALKDKKVMFSLLHFAIWANAIGLQLEP